VSLETEYLLNIIKMFNTFNIPTGCTNLMLNMKIHSGMTVLMILQYYLVVLLQIIKKVSKMLKQFSTKINFKH